MNNTPYTLKVDINVTSSMNILIKYIKYYAMCESFVSICVSLRICYHVLLISTDGRADSFSDRWCERLQDSATRPLRKRGK